MKSKGVLAIARKDLVDAIRNRYLLIALLTPLLVALLLRVLLPGLNGLNTLTIVVHDPGKSQIVSELRASGQINLVEASAADAVSAAVEKNKAAGGLAVPANFDAELAAARQPELTIYVNNRKGDIERAVFRQLLQRQIMSLVKQPVPVRPVWIDVGEEPGGRASPNLNQMLLPLLVLMAFTMTGALVVPMLLVEEKEKRTMEFLLTSPTSLTEIIAGKALTGIVYGLLIGGVLLALNHKLIGNWPLTLLTISLGLLLIVSVGLLMGSLFQNTMQVNTWAGFVLLILLAPSFPSPGLPATVETILHLIPTHSFVEALRLSMSGTPSPRMWGHLGVVLSCTALAFFAATWGLRRAQN
jgi:ABC-2 type transport system permease protein